MLTLYYRPTCQFCRRVMAVIDRLDLTVDMKDISESAVESELLSVAGRIQVPYLIDTDHNVALFESDEIVDHLQKTYGTLKTPTRVRVHISDNACVSCEG